MATTDPEVLQALQIVFEARRGKHVRGIRAKQHEQQKARFETLVEMTLDEVESALDPKHPAFFTVLCLSVFGKLKKRPAEVQAHDGFTDFPL